MTATARRMRRGARTITTGKQLRGQLTGPGTHVGPNALLRSSSYPAVSVTVGDTQGTNGPLFVPATPSGGAPWRIDGTDEIDNTNNGLALNWAGWSGSTPPTYIYSNSPSNLGGVVPSGGMHIDGWLVPAGTYVFQFMDLSNPPGVLYYQGSGPTAPNIVFRGCRIRNSAPENTADGFFNNNTGATPSPQQLWILYCDLGGLGPATDGTGLIDEVYHTYNSGLTVYRTYVSYVGSGFFPLMSDPVTDLYENYIEKITAFGGDHLNGISFNGGESNCRVKRNHIVTARYDDNGVQVTDTDCIAFFDDFNGPAFYPGTGTNPDGTTGYQFVGNYMGGTGYCVYTAAIGYVPSNAYWVNNLITTSSYAIGDTSDSASGNGGGFNGPVYTSAAPNWGSNGNFKSNNIWADGLDRGSTWM